MNSCFTQTQLFYASEPLDRVILVFLLLLFAANKCGLRLTGKSTFLRHLCKEPERYFLEQFSRILWYHTYTDQETIDELAGVAGVTFHKHAEEDGPLFDALKEQLEDSSDRRTLVVLDDYQGQLERSARNVEIFTGELFS